MVEQEYVDAWAGIAHQRYALRRLAQQRTLELAQLEAVANRLRVLSERVGARRLASVAATVLTWADLAYRTEAREQAGALLLELSEALDHACDTRGRGAVVRAAQVALN